MQILSTSYQKNIEYIRARLRVGESFDVIEKRIDTQSSELSFFYIDGFTKDGEMQRIMQYLLSKKTIGTAREFSATLPYIEVSVSNDTDEIIRAVLSGQTAVFSKTFSKRRCLSTQGLIPQGIPRSPRGTGLCLAQGTVLLKRLL